MRIVRCIYHVNHQPSSSSSSEYSNRGSSNGDRARVFTSRPRDFFRMSHVQTSAGSLVNSAEKFSGAADGCRWPRPAGRVAATADESSRVRPYLLEENYYLSRSAASASVGSRFGRRDRCCAQRQRAPCALAAVHSSSKWHASCADPRPQRRRDRRC